MFLTPQQIQELLGIINRFHAIFIATNVGTDILSQEDKDILTNSGIDLTTIPPNDYITQAFKFGILSQALKHDDVVGMDYTKFKSFLNSGRFLPLTRTEELALQAVKQQCYGDIKGLGNRIIQKVNQTVIQVSARQKRAVEKQINKLAQNAIKNRQSIQQFSSELGHMTLDWSRDFDRISDYIMHSAYQHGRAEHLLKTQGDDVEIYFTVYMGACKHCIGTYLTADVGSEPIVFKLTDVLKNGSNIGRKSADWLPSVDPLHPWCRCTLTIKPENSVWDDKKQMFVLTRNTYGVKRKSKIQVTIKKN